MLIPFLLISSQRYLSHLTYATLLRSKDNVDAFTSAPFLLLYPSLFKSFTSASIDLNSRYFIEDLDFGLCIIKAFAEICEVDTPTVDKVIYWAQNLLNKDYLVNGKLQGKDAKNLITPQNKGINTKEELIEYYKSL